MIKARTVFRDHPVGSYFVLVYAIAWIAGIPLLVSGTPIRNAPAVGILTAFGPLIAACVVALATSGLKGVAGLLRPYLRVKAPLKAYALAAVPFMVGTAAAIAWALSGGARPDRPPFSSAGDFIGGMLSALILGPFSEEAGWRGWALPRMQAKRNALAATVVLGLAWVFWHAPLWLLPEGRGDLFNFACFFVNGMGIAVFMTAVWNASGGSLFLCVLAHFGANVGSIGLGLIPPDRIYAWNAAAWIIVTAIAIPALGAASLAGRKTGEANHSRAGEAS